MTDETEEIFMTSNSISKKGLLMIGMALFLYYLTIIGCTVVNFPRLP